VAAGGGVFEFKAVERFVPRHRAQLLHFLLLTEQKHGMLVNIRPERVEREFVNSVLAFEDRFRFEPTFNAWDDAIPGTAIVRETLLELLSDWGTALELALYEAALTHFLGGDAVVLQKVCVELDSVLLGEQPFRLADEHVAFKLTAFEDPQSLPRFRIQSERLVAHTDLTSLLWINIARDQVTFQTVP